MPSESGQWPFFLMAEHVGNYECISWFPSNLMSRGKKETCFTVIVTFILEPGQPEAMCSVEV